jgi:hypothetical protein
MWYGASVTKPDGSDVEQRMAAIEVAVRERVQELDSRRGSTGPVLAQGTLVENPEPPPAALDERIREALTAAAESLSPDQLAAAIGAEVGAVTAALRRLVHAGHVHNVGVGREGRLVYTWRVGAQASADELERAVLQLLRERPTTVDELHVATGAPLVRVSRIVDAIRRDPELRPRLRDLSGNHTGSWLLLSPAITGSDSHGD